MSLTAQLQRTDQWVLDRGGRLTASQFGAALGLSPFTSRVALWKQLTGRSAPFTGNEATDWGTLHEKDALHALEVDTGLLVHPCRFIPYEDWSGCSPDGRIEGNGIVEAKAPYSQRLYEDIPLQYKAQVLGQLGITKASFALFICWTPHEYRIWRVDPDPKTWDRMEEALKEFWRCVKDDVEPKRAKKFNF